MALVPHQGLVSRNRWVRAPGSRTAAPSFKNCRTVETMFAIRQILHGRVLDRSYYYACLVFKHCGCSGQLEVEAMLDLNTPQTSLDSSKTKLTT